LFLAISNSRVLHAIELSIPILFVIEWVKKELKDPK